jgi:hypothetical protein
MYLKAFISQRILMRTSKAFIFSLDSFVAFILTVAALYSLLFFSTVPSAYYSSLMQANYLAKDTLLTLATTECTDKEDCEGMTYLDYILQELEESNYAPAREYIGRATYSTSKDALIPEQFGYKIEVMRADDNWSNEDDWVTTAPDEYAYYDTRLDSDSANKKDYNKLKAAAHILFFAYSEVDPAENPYGYITCKGGQTICEVPHSEYEFGKANMEVVRFTVYT